MALPRVAQTYEFASFDTKVLPVSRRGAPYLGRDESLSLCTCSEVPFPFQIPSHFRAARYFQIGSLGESEALQALLGGGGGGRRGRPRLRPGLAPALDMAICTDPGLAGQPFARHTNTARRWKPRHGTCSGCQPRLRPFRRSQSIPLTSLSPFPSPAAAASREAGGSPAAALRKQRSVPVSRRPATL